MHVNAEAASSFMEECAGRHSKESGSANSPPFGITLARKGRKSAAFRPFMECTLTTTE